MVLRQDIGRRRPGDGIGKCLAVGINSRRLHGAEQILEQDLRRLRRREPVSRGRLDANGRSESHSA